MSDSTSTATQKRNWFTELLLIIFTLLLLPLTVIASIAGWAWYFFSEAFMEAYNAAAERMK